MLCLHMFTQSHQKPSKNEFTTRSRNTPNYQKYQAETFIAGLVKAFLFTQIGATESVQLEQQRS